jgi:hypothetical protein
MQKTKAKVILLKQPDASSNPKPDSHTPVKKRQMPKTAQRKSSHLREVPNPQLVEPPEQPPELAEPPEPVFSQYTLRGPDGKERGGWSLHINGVLIGKAESKESLLEYYTRLAEPLSSNHWRDSLVRRRTRRDPIAPPTEEGHSAETEAETETDPTAEKSDQESDQTLRASA